MELKSSEHVGEEEQHHGNGTTAKPDDDIDHIDEGKSEQSGTVGEENQNRTTVVVEPVSTSTAANRETPLRRRIRLLRTLYQFLCVIIGHALLLFAYLTFVIVICIEAPMGTWERAVCTSVASVLQVIVFFCYWAVMATPAGFVPETWKAPEEYLTRHEQGPVIGVKEEVLAVMPSPVYTRDRNGTVRFCRKCVAVKPDRAHHCYTCGGCTVRFDHHCPWMGRCIGYRNHKLFYMFTFYGFLLALFYVIVTLIVAIRHFSGDMPMDTYITVLDIVILISTFLFGGCFVGGLFFSHTLLLLQNKTTFERLRPQKSVLDLPPNERLFDIGWRANWAAVMGPNPMMWLVPVPTRYVTDGCSFPLNSKAKGDGAHAV